MSSSPFLSLPAEIRNRIYALCTPLHVHTEEFRGLHSASRQLRHEYQHEALLVIHQFLTSIKQQWPHSEDVLFDGPKTLRDMDKITVMLPLSRYFLTSRTGSPTDTLDYPLSTRLEDCLKPLFTLHLTRLTFTFYDDSASFVNWNPSIVPLGLLIDLINPLIIPKPVPYEAHMLKRRAFQFYKDYGPQDLHIRELEYNWKSSKVAHASSDLNALVQADSQTLQHFLQMSGSFQYPGGYVHNWGLGEDSVWLDLKVPEGMGW